MIEIGPHILKYEAPWGSHGEIIIVIKLEGDHRISLGGEDFIDERIGSIYIASDWFDRTMRFPAQNDIQLIQWLMITSEIYIKKICKDNGVSIYRVIPGDIEESGSIYKP